MSKDEVIELCSHLQNMLNFKEEKHKVDFFLGFKPSIYYLPMIHIGTSSSINNKKENALFAEIFVDGRCIFRESYIPRETEDLKVAEGMLITRLIKSVFCHGVWSQKQVLENLKTL